MSETIERIDALRDRSLTWFLTSFLIWSGGSIALILYLSFGWRSLSGGLGRLLGYLIWVWFLAFLFLWVVMLGRYLLIRGRIGRDPVLTTALNDEGVRSAWLRAASTGFWTMLAAEVAFVLIRVGTGGVIALGLAPVELVMLQGVRSPVVLAVGVGVTVGRYLRLRRA
jgi:hypothetical protein